MLLTHHPLIFKAIKKVNDQNFITRRLVKLIQADISYYAMHTNFDSAPGCMADLAAERIGICGGEPLEAAVGIAGDTDAHARTLPMLPMVCMISVPSLKQMSRVSLLITLMLLTS